MEIEEQFVLATGHMLSEEYDQAIDILQKLLKKDKENPVIFYQLGRNFLGKKDIEKAQENLKKAVKLDASNPHYVLALGMLYEEKSLFVQANQVYQKYTGDVFYEKIILQKSIHNELVNGTPENAIDLIDHLTTKAGIQVDLLRQKFEILDSLDRSSEATDVLALLANKYPANISFKLNYANYLVQQGNNSRAKEVFDDVLTLDPMNEEAKNFKAFIGKKADSKNDKVNRLLSKLENPALTIDQKIQSIIPVLEKLSVAPDTNISVPLFEYTSQDLGSSNPNNVKVAVLEGDLAFISNKFIKAEQAYKRALKIDGSNIRVWEQLFEVQLVLKNYSALVKSTDRALYRFPNQAMIFYYQSLGYLFQDNAMDAKSSLSEGRLLFGNQAGLIHLFDLADMFAAFKEGDKARLSRMVDKLKETNTWSPHAFYIIVHCYGLVDDLDNVLRWKKQGLSSFPNHPLLVNI